MDQAGIDVYLSIFRYLYEKLGRDNFIPPSILERYVSSGRLGVKTGLGFYEYGESGAEKLMREKDRKFYARLRLFEEERFQSEV